MKTYWDLSEKQRADLSPDDVGRFIDAELMTAGVLRAEPLALEPEPAIPAPSRLLYAVRVNAYLMLPIAFASSEDAEKFMALRPQRIDNMWLDHDSIEFVEQIDKHEIVARSYLTAAEKDGARADLKRAAEVRAENARRREEYKQATEAQEATLSSMWGDWQACTAKRARLQRVFDTFRDYERVADGDATVAARFLGKAFSAVAIAETADWFGVDIPRPSSVEAA